jgi:NADPH:quinone reductase-like Zn-dependent oxidoreductase
LCFHSLKPCPGFTLNWSEHLSEVHPMQAAVVEVPGQAPKYRSFPDPVAEAGEALVRVRAAGLHPVVKAIASGAHYSAAGAAPVASVPGIDGVGVLDDGRRVYFGVLRKPWGTMAERAPAALPFCIPVPDGLDDLQAAAIVNPGMSAWVALQYRAAFIAGETVLILGATGVAGQLAVQSARLMGAKRVIAAGRNTAALAGADVDAVIGLAGVEDAVREALTAEAATGIDVVIDYLWGRPAELLLEGLAKGLKGESTRRTRWVEVGESAGSSITLPGSVLRSVDLVLMGSGFGSASMDRLLATIPELLKLAAAGTLTVAVEPVPLAEVESAWTRMEKGRRIVFTME